jgi:hypothetical protein
MNIQEMLEKTAKKSTGLHSKLKKTTYTPPDQRPWDDDFRNEITKNTTNISQIDQEQDAIQAEKTDLVHEFVPVQKPEPVQKTVPLEEFVLVQKPEPVQIIELAQEPVPVQKIEPVQENVPVQRTEPVQESILVQKTNQYKNKTSSELGAVKKTKIDLTSIELVKKGISEIRLKEIIKANTNGQNEKVRLGRMFLIENGIPKSSITIAIKTLLGRGEITHEYEFCENKKQNVNVFSWIK